MSVPRSPALHELRDRPHCAGGQPGVMEEVQTETQTQLASPWNVIVHDDPISLMAYVVLVFQRVFGFDLATATRHMKEVHDAGRSVLWTGAREQAELYVSKLHAAQLRSTLERVNA